MSFQDHDLITDIKPIGGGWRYPQAHDDKTVTLRGKNAKALLTEVIDFRLNHRIEAGEPEKDIADFIKRASPLNDRFRGKSPGKPVRKIEPPLIERIRNNIALMARERPALVMEPEAIERAEICMRCPQNIAFASGCGDCNKAIEYEGKCLRAQPTFAHDDALRACRLHEIHLPSFVFIDRDHLPTRKPGVEKCWLPEPNGRTKPERESEATESAQLARA